jgi:cold shock CspA family protein
MTNQRHAERADRDWEVGFVSWYDASRGYGFLRAPDDGEVFLPRSAVLAAGIKDLQRGDEVEFVRRPASRGRRHDEVSALRA